MNEQNLSQDTNVAVLPTSTLAIVSLISGILGFTMLPLIGTIVALITGYSARKETRAVPPTHSGDGFATAGIVMGWIQVGLWSLLVCIFIIFLLFFTTAVSTSFN